MIITNSAAETRELGKRLAVQLKAGDVILLEGDLGAGKSELARGVAKGLGVQETVTSPSFTILNVYESGSIPLYHFDWYRLESSEELYVTERTTSYGHKRTGLLLALDLDQYDFTTGKLPIRATEATVKERLPDRKSVV